MTLALLLALQLAHKAALVESYPGLKVEYGAVQAANGPAVRTIVTAPEGGVALPGIFVVGWLSCDSIELNRENLHGVDRLLRDVVRESRALVMRMDKPGVGDSQGDCAKTDFDTELAAYRAAFAAFLQDARLDKSRVTMLGVSNGGGFAPLVAGSGPVAKYVSIDGWSKTWFEHMIALERRRLAFEGAPDATAQMKKLSAFHAAYLLDGLTPAQVEARHPSLKGVWYDGPDSQYGRPARFYQQLQALDLMSAWSNVHVPTLIVWGEYDWIMDRGDQELIAGLVGPRARLLVVPHADHVMSVHPDARTAYRRMGEGEYPAEAAAQILAFLRG